MSDDFKVGQTPPLINPQPGYKYSDPSIDFSIAVKDSMALQAHKIAEHEGKIAGLTSIVQALQSYKGFLQAAIIAVGALLFAGLAILFNLQLSSGSRTEKGIDGLSTRVSTIETKVDALPVQLSREIREASRDMVLLTRPAASIPPTPATGAKP